MQKLYARVLAIMKTLVIAIPLLLTAAGETKVRRHLLNN